MDSWRCVITTLFCALCWSEAPVTAAVSGIPGMVIGWGPGTDYYPIPGGLTNAVSLSSGGHVLALRADSTVAAWGNNNQKQCDTPMGLTNIIAVSAGSTHSLALHADGTVA